MSGVCSICKTKTEYACSDCRIDFHTTIYVCSSPACRDKHEEKCSSKLRAKLAAATKEKEELAAVLERNLDLAWDISQKGHHTNYDWNADPKSLTLLESEMYAVRDKTAAILASVKAEARAEGWKAGLAAFAEHIRNTWGLAYPLDLFAEVGKDELDPTLRSRCSASMGRHMAKKIEEEAREMADAEEKNHAT